MSREIKSKYRAEGRILRLVTDEVTTAIFRLETITEQMIAKENPEMNDLRLQEILDICASVKAYLGFIR